MGDAWSVKEAGSGDCDDEDDSQVLNLDALISNQ